MGDPRHDLGLAAERAVASWLTSRGWRVLGRRQRTASGGELDLVALDPLGVLVAIEVRARSSRRAGDASHSLDARRVARLRRSLGTVGAMADQPHVGLRVDLVTAEPMPDRSGRWRLARVPDLG